MDAASRGGVPEWGRAPPNDGARYNADPDGRALDVVVLDCGGSGGSGGSERREASESESDDDSGEQSPERKQRRLAMSRSASSASNSLAG